MRRLAAFWTWFMLASMAMADPVDVRSGSHEGFTRLVFYLPQGTEWSLSRDAGIATLATTPAAPFDLSEVFSRISRERLANIRPGATPGQVEIELACDCTLREQVLLGNALVLDLVDPTDSDPEVSPTARPMARTPATQTADPAPMPPSTPESPSITEARRLTDLVTRSFGSRSAQGEGERAEQLAEMETEILLQVARATTQGFLSANGRIEPQAKPEETPKTDPEADAKTTPVAMEPPSALTHTATRGEEGQVPLTYDGALCLPDEKFDLASWAGDKGFSGGLGALRTQLADAVDDTNQETALSLARFYVAFGLGAEAANTLTMLDETAETAHLASLARVVERGVDMVGSPLLGQSDCDTAAALWSFLAEDPAEPGPKHINESAVLRTLNAMPEPVREYIGVMVAERSLKVGRQDLSQAVLRILDRSSPEKSARQALVEGQLDLATGELEQARESLEKSAAAASDPSPDALVTLVFHDIAEGNRISPETTDLLSAYVFQYRAAPIVEDLRKAEILARASLGQFDVAFDLLPAVDSSGGRLSTADKAVQFLTTDADDATFLRLASEKGLPLVQAIGQETALSFGRRLLHIGFPELAIAALEAPFDNRAEPDRKLIRARASLVMGHPQEALAELDGQSGPDAESVRAEVMAAMGDHLTASETFLGADQTARAQRQSWLAGDWEGLRQAEEEPLYAVAARIMLPALAEPEKTEIGELQRNRQLLEETSDSRALVQSLLDRYKLGSQAEN